MGSGSSTAELLVEAALVVVVVGVVVVDSPASPESSDVQPAASAPVRMAAPISADRRDFLDSPQSCGC